MTFIIVTIVTLLPALVFCAPALPLCKRKEGDLCGCFATFVGRINEPGICFDPSPRPASVSGNSSWGADGRCLYTDRIGGGCPSHIITNATLGLSAAIKNNNFWEIIGFCETPNGKSHAALKEELQPNSAACCHKPNCASCHQTGACTKCATGFYPINMVDGYYDYYDCVSLTEMLTKKATTTSKPTISRPATSKPLAQATVEKMTQMMQTFTEMMQTAQATEANDITEKKVEIETTNSAQTTSESIKETNLNENTIISTVYENYFSSNLTKDISLEDSVANLTFILLGSGFLLLLIIVIVGILFAYCRVKAVLLDSKLEEARKERETPKNSKEQESIKEFRLQCEQLPSPPVSMHNKIVFNSYDDVQTNQVGFYDIVSQGKSPYECASAPLGQSNMFLPLATTGNAYEHPQSPFIPMATQSPFVPIEQNRSRYEGTNATFMK